MKTGKAKLVAIFAPVLAGIAFTASAGELHTAAYRGDIAAITAALESGADPNTKGKDGKTPLQRVIDLV